MKTHDTLIAVARQNPDTPTLDLHGQSRYEAEYAVDAFLHTSQHAGEQVVKILHGIGTGALAEFVPTYLSSHPLVAYAEQIQGREVYVVLN